MFLEFLWLLFYHSFLLIQTFDGIVDLIIDMKKHREIPLLTNKIIVILLMILFFPLGIYAIWKHKLWSVKARQIITASFVVLTLLIGVGSYNAPPTISLASTNKSNSTISTDGNVFTVKGDISTLHKASVKINDNVVKTYDYSKFSEIVDLTEGDNTIKIVAVSEKGKDEESFIIHRTTAAEFSERNRIAAIKKADEINAKKQAEAADALLAAEKKSKVESAQDIKREGELYKVISITDGDTIKVSINGKTETIRFIGMDTPETKDPRKPVQCFGKEASSKMQSFAQSKMVRLKSDNSQGDRDKYNRLLRYVYLEDGRNIAYEMIRGGYAHEYTYNTPYEYQVQFKAAEKYVMNQGDGLWSKNTCNGDTDQQLPKKPSGSSSGASEGSSVAKPAPRPNASCFASACSK